MTNAQELMKIAKLRMELSALHMKNVTCYLKIIRDDLNSQKAGAGRRIHYGVSWALDAPNSFDRIRVRDENNRTNLIDAINDANRYLNNNLTSHQRNTIRQLFDGKYDRDSPVSALYDDMGSAVTQRMLNVRDEIKASEKKLAPKYNRGNIRRITDPIIERDFNKTIQLYSVKPGQMKSHRCGALCKSIKNHSCNRHTTVLSCWQHAGKPSSTT
ncbi:MAG TPA: hypothetical protein VLF17_06305 [Candidatus Nitrosotenuis sp.]|nr:hypothetical protein [Candidatus Nitrosotenuis sp.]